MKAFKKPLLLTTVILAAFVLGGCNLIQGLFGSEEEPVEKQPVVLTYWGLWEPDSVMQEVIDSYEAANPHVTIQYVRRPFSGGVYKDQLLSRLSSADTQESPDIMRIHNTWLPQFYKELAPLPDGVMSSAEYSQTFYETAERDFSLNSEIYGIPLMVDTLGLFYNKDIMESNGKLIEGQDDIVAPDWDAFITLAEDITVWEDEDKKEGIEVAGAALGTSANILHSEEILSLLMLQSNIQMVDLDADQPKAVFDETDINKTEGVLDFYSEFVSRYKVWGPELPNDLDQFIEGKLGMMIAPSWRAFDIFEANPSFQFATTKVPQLTLSGNRIDFSTYWGDVVSKDAENTEEAWKFVKYLSEKEQLQKMYDRSSQLRAFGAPYPRKDMRDDIKDAPYVGPFVEMAPTAKSWVMGNDTVARAELNKMIDGASTTGQVKSVIEEAALNISLELVDIFDENN